MAAVPFSSLQGCSSYEDAVGKIVALAKGLSRMGHPREAEAQDLCKLANWLWRQKYGKPLIEAANVRDEPPDSDGGSQPKGTMTDEEQQQAIKAINELSQYEMCRLRRFAPCGHPYFDSTIPAVYEAFQKRYKELGGLTPEISKELGWDRPC